MRELAQADPAKAELLVHRAWAATAVAARVVAHLEPRWLAGFLDQRLLSQLLLSFGALLCERHPEPAQEREALLVGLGGRRDRDVQAADARDRVVVDLREDDLLADPEREVAPSVEGPRVQTPEIADAREGDRHEPVEELPHAGATQRDARADRHALANLEAGDRLPRLAHLRAL